MYGWFSLFRFCICKFAYLVKFVTTKLILTVLWSLSTDMSAERGRKCDLPKTHNIPTEAKQSDTSPSSFSSPTVNKCLTKDYLVLTFRIFVLFVGEFAV